MPLLSFSPADAIVFEVDATGAKAVLTVRNLSPTSHVAFKVKTNAAERYSVRPHMALLSPGEAKLVQLAVSAAQLSKFRDDMARQTSEGRRHTAFLMLGWAVPAATAEALRGVDGGPEALGAALQAAWKAQDAVDRAAVAAGAASCFEQRKFPSVARADGGDAGAGGPPPATPTTQHMPGGGFATAAPGGGAAASDPSSGEPSDIGRLAAAAAAAAAGDGGAGSGGGSGASLAASERRRADELRALLLKASTELDALRKAAEAEKREKAALRVRLAEAQDAARALPASAADGGGSGLRQRVAGTKAKAAGSDSDVDVDASAPRVTGFLLWQLLLVAIIMFLLGRASVVA